MISRKEKIQDLEKKIIRTMNYYLYSVLKERSFMLMHIRLWKSMTNQIEEISEWDKKFKNNYTTIKIDALPLNITE
jgi:hypothetical protein